MAYRICSFIFQTLFDGHKPELEQRKIGILAATEVLLNGEFVCPQ